MPEGEVHKTSPSGGGLSGGEQFGGEDQAVIRDLSPVDVQVLESGTEVTDLVFFDTNLQNLVGERKPIAVHCEAVIAIGVIPGDTRRLEDFEAQEFRDEALSDQSFEACR